MQQKNWTLLKREVHSSGGFSYVKVKTVCIYEGRKKESSLMIELNRIFSAEIEQTFLLPSVLA